ncbi:hypothetical protein NQ314_009324 [Rhamnusium bicolor]|uniref:Uncharacterized protein n=1 Tax=Rhamnusium bicolor TaxID=1586634 RepID=A0AAV8Y360_9CUCU|nr:hypothetical protein NQ314_009324 [Rhamnusium bicolor]
MNREDVVYLCLLLFSMVFGVCYRRIHDVDYKKKTGALVGLLIIFIVSGLHSVHVLITVFINACPYYRYTTYLDHLTKPYYKYDNYKEALLKKLYLIPLLGGIHLITSYYWPLSYVFSDEFYNRSFLYRYWYIWPVYLVFRSRLYFGLVLTEMVCITGGLGLYPDFSRPKPGRGPTENFKKTKATSLRISKLVMLFLKMQMFSYQTVSFILLELGKIFHYYNSVYHCITILYLGLYILGQYLLHRKVLAERKFSQENGKEAQNDLKYKQG